MGFIGDFVLKLVTPRSNIGSGVVFLCLLSLLLLFAMDTLLGNELRLHMLYVFPVAAAALHCSRSLDAILVSVAAAAAQICIITSYEFSVTSKFVSISVAVIVLILISVMSRAARRAYLLAQRLMETDQLTSILNRRGFESLLQSEIARQSRYGSSFSLAMIDLDSFKELNDIRGHMFGDEALKLTAEKLTSITRPSDKVARLGGDEFAVLMPNTNLVECEEVCKRIVLSLADEMRSHGFNITASLGSVSFYQPPLDERAALDMVDKVLYQAKARGKNCAISQ